MTPLADAMLRISVSDKLSVGVAAGTAAAICIWRKPPWIKDVFIDGYLETVACKQAEQAQARLKLKEGVFIEGYFATIAGKQAEQGQARLTEKEDEIKTQPEVANQPQTRLSTAAQGIAATFTVSPDPQAPSTAPSSTLSTAGATESPSQDRVNALLDDANGKLAAAQQRVAALEKELENSADYAQAYTHTHTQTHTHTHTHKLISIYVYVYTTH